MPFELHVEPEMQAPDSNARLRVIATGEHANKEAKFTWKVPERKSSRPVKTNPFPFTTPAKADIYPVSVKIEPVIVDDFPEQTLEGTIEVTTRPWPQAVVDSLREGITAVSALQTSLEAPTRLERQLPPLGPDKALWAIIRNRANAISFDNYKTFIDAVMCGEPAPDGTIARRHLQRRVRNLQFYGEEQYEVLRQATEAFLMHETGTALDQIEFSEPQEEKRRLPQIRGTNDPDIVTDLKNNRDDYLERLARDCKTLPYFATIIEKLSDIPLKPVPADPENPICYGILKSRVCPPLLLELIWSYWHEEGMLVETLKSISLRFQNKRAKPGPDPLARLDIDPLRPLNNLIWGYIQGGHHRLSASRRAFEYDHHYGLSPAGQPVSPERSVDSRSKFIAAFHNLLHRCAVFYKEQANTVIVPDGFPLLNGLKEIHLLLAEGAHNQFGDLPWTARVEMLMEQWILARPETRGFLSGRIMVPDSEPWMGAVDRMKGLQGWSDTPVRHFRDLGVFGEQIILSIRYALWSEETDETRARVWAQYWKPEIQSYMDAYRVVTGVDLTRDAVSVERLRSRRMPPAEHLRRRQAKQRRPI